jgi:hypothetical protein
MAPGSSGDYTARKGSCFGPFSNQTPAGQRYVQVMTPSTGWTDRGAPML